MKIETIPLEDHQVKLTVEFEADQFLEAKQKAARNLAKKIKIPGFRPGKAPYSVIARFVGDDTIIEEGVELLVKDFYPKIIEAAKVKPYGPGRLENISSIDPLRIDFIVPLEAEIKLGDFRSIRIPYEPEDVSDKDVEEFLEDLRWRYAIEETIDRPAQEHDHLIIKFEAREFDAEEKGKVLITERQLSIIIADKEKDTREEWPFSGFSRELIGLSVGDKKRIIHSFSENSPFEELRGKTIEFSIFVEEVRARQLPEVDDEFARTIGDFENLEQLKVEIRKSLETRALIAYNEEYDELVLDQILAQSELKYPPQMVEDEIDEVINALIHRLNKQGFDLDTYLKTREIDLNTLREEAKQVAEKRIKRSLVLFKIAEQENIEVESSELQAETEKTLDTLGRFASDNEKRKIYSQSFIRSTAANLYAEMRIAKTLEFIRNIARGLVVDGLDGDHPIEDSLVGEDRETSERSTVTELDVSNRSQQGVSGDLASEKLINDSEIEA